MKKILMVAHFCDYGDEDSNNRFNYLLHLINNSSDLKGILLTSRFSHRLKKKRKDINSFKLNGIYLVDEPGYKKNISLRRFISHKFFSRNLKKKLKYIEKPDVIYCAVPSLDSANVVVKYAKKNKIKLIIDIQDLWPEAFKLVFKSSILNRILFYPMTLKANYIYSAADKIVAVSDTYRNRALRNNKKDLFGLTIFLGTDLNYLNDSLKNQDLSFIKHKNEKWIGYIGTLGNSYDINTVLHAMKNVQRKMDNVKLIIIGDGPQKNNLYNLAKKLSVNAVFLGKKDYIEAMKILQQCDIAVNPLRKGAAQSIINKVGDYAALGLPVVNSLQNEEYKALLTKYKAGINIRSEDISEMTKAFYFLLKNTDIAILMGQNNLQLAVDMFDRNKTYLKIISLLREL